MIVALLSQHGSGGKATPAPHFANQSSRQRKRIAPIDADPQGAELDWSEQGARQRRYRLVGGVGLVRDMPDREAAGLARDQDHSIIDDALHVAALPGTALVQRGSAVSDTLRRLPARDFSDTKGERS